MVLAARVHRLTLQDLLESTVTSPALAKSHTNMPPATPSSASGSESLADGTWDYFNGQPPAALWAALRVSLALLVAVLIVCRTYFWIRRSHAPANSALPCSNTAVLGSTKPQQVQQQQQQEQQEQHRALHNLPPQPLPLSLPLPLPLPQPLQPPSRRVLELPEPYWVMKEKTGAGGDSGSGDGAGARDHHVSFLDDDGVPMGRKLLAIDPRWKANGDAVSGIFMSRPPPAPPLTPPELSSTVFTLDGRPISRDSFFNQPNPDYTSASTVSSGSQPSSSDSPIQPRRRSYNKTIPIGVPGSRQSTASDADLTFSPSSYPPTSPILPPAPPKLPGSMLDEGKALEATQIDMQGEIVSMLNSDGAGWTRHTRVYGGGACLACAAAGREHGDGGFYGATVRPEEMR